MKVLFYGESPVIDTGLAKVSRVIIDALLALGHEVTIVGTNHNLVISHEGKYDVVPIKDGDDGNVTQTAVDLIHNSEYDMFFCSTDFGRDTKVFQALIEERMNGRKVFIVGYYAVDCDIIPPCTFDALAYCNAKIVYTEHGKRVIESLCPEYKGLVNVLYLPTEPDVFYPLSREEKRAARKEIFGIEDDSHFLAVSVNRNQGRKDLGRLMAIFHEFHKTHPNSTLYMHAAKNDIGGSLETMAASLGMSSSKEHPELMYSGAEYSSIRGYTTEFLNRVYNAADVFVSASTGEGWGYGHVEAMTAGTPVVVPNNTAFTEIVGENEERGYLVKSGGDIDHQIFLYQMTNNPRDIVHSNDFLEKLGRVYFRPHEARYKAQDAREWTLKYSRKITQERWKGFFTDLDVMMPQLLEAQTV